MLPIYVQLWEHGQSTRAIPLKKTDFFSSRIQPIHSSTARDEAHELLPLHDRMLIGRFCTLGHSCFEFELNSPTISRLHCFVLLLSGLWLLRSGGSLSTVAPEPGEGMLYRCLTVWGLPLCSGPELAEGMLFRCPICGRVLHGYLFPPLYSCIHHYSLPKETSLRSESCANLRVERHESRGWFGTMFA